MRWMYEKKKDKLKQRFGRRPVGFAYRHFIVFLERIPLGGTIRGIVPRYLGKPCGNRIGNKD